MNAGIFHEPSIDFTHPSSHTRHAMTPVAVVIIVLCVAVVSGVLVWTLLALKKTALRAESVLGLLEREVRPMASELEGLLTEVRSLTGRANKEMERVSAIVKRAEDVSAQASRLAQAVGGFTKVGQAVALLIGLKRGANIFVKRLKQ
jgi:uncharacterized protein YoxC